MGSETGDGCAPPWPHPSRHPRSWPLSHLLQVSFHLSALESQLTEVYHAFALAWVLNRTLVMPRIKCWCIQNWFENPLCR